MPFRSKDFLASTPIPFRNLINLTKSSTSANDTNLHLDQPTELNTSRSTYAPAIMSSEEDRVKKQHEAGERESAKLWRAWRTVHEMVQDRGYELSEAEVKVSLDDFKRKYMGDDGTIRYEGICACVCEHRTDFFQVART